MSAVIPVHRSTATIPSLLYRAAVPHAARSKRAAKSWKAERHSARVSLYADLRLRDDYASGAGAAVWSISAS